MAASIIDALVVTLGLDARDWSKQEREAIAGLKRLEKSTGDLESRTKRFNELTKKLGIDQSKLNDQQKKSYEALQKLALQHQKTRGEIEKSSGATDDFTKALKGWGTAIVGAVSLGAMASFARNQAAFGQSTVFMAANLDMSAKSVVAWGNAIQRAVGGDAGSARSNLMRINSLLQSFDNGQDPETMRMLSAQFGMYGVSVTGRDDKGALLAPDQFAMQLAGAADAMRSRKNGRQKFNQILGSTAGLDQDFLNLLWLGRGGLTREIAASSGNDDKWVKPLEDLSKSSTALEVASESLGRAATALTSGFFARVMDRLWIVLEFFRYKIGDISEDQYNSEYEGMLKSDPTFKRQDENISKNETLKENEWAMESGHARTMDKANNPFGIQWAPNMAQSDDIDQSSPFIEYTDTSGQKRKMAHFKSNVSAAHYQYGMLKNWLARGYDTIEKMIYHYEGGDTKNNNIPAYQKYVSGQTGIAGDKKLFEKDLPGIISAIGKYESGSSVSVKGGNSDNSNNNNVAINIATMELHTKAENGKQAATDLVSHLTSISSKVIQSQGALR